MMPKTASIIVALVVSLPLVQCATTSTSPKEPKREMVTENQLGHVLPGYFFSIDAAYDPSIEGIIPGYTAITVAVVNKSLKPLEFRPDTDRWKIKDRKKKWHRAVNEIQYEAPEAWESLHPEARRLISYPVLVPPGYTQTFQLFFPGDDIDFAGFYEIQHYNAGLNKTFTFTRY